ncbi:CD1871A family CXXC motif-containing protein [Vallitalea longa]|uniref:CD1871A family CXXC motif-containing protein n=1 Tax=Vallitalea longa TaxID=2936439 RepID=UPI002490953C|nr:CD1871A family CXXC motif-containing protein [Vallitalea longa]
MIRNKTINNLITFGLILVGIICVVIGIYRNEISIVLQKAINICLECVGIG